MCGAGKPRLQAPGAPLPCVPPPNYLPLRSELNESRRVTSLSAVSPPPCRPTATSWSGGGCRDGRGWNRTSVRRSEEGRWMEQRTEREKESICESVCVCVCVCEDEREAGGKVGQVLSGYFPYPKWLNLIPNSGSRARHKSRHKHPRCYFLFLPRVFSPTRPIRHLLPRLQHAATGLRRCNAPSARVGGRAVVSALNRSRDAQVREFQGRFRRSTAIMIFCPSFSLTVSFFLSPFLYLVEARKDIRLIVQM